ncbi:MAG: DUF5107 domain-containing protein [Bacteroidota bacterium]
MKKNIISLIIIISIISFTTTMIYAQEGKAKCYEIEEEILEHNQLPLNPYPPFGLLTGYIAYPYQFYGSKNYKVDKKKIKILVAENEYLKIGMAPDYGGRLWFVYDKIRNKEVIHRNYKEAKFYNSGMGYQYLGGGMELNIPNAHSHTNARKRECVMRENEDGSVSLIMSNTEKIGRLHWSVKFTLFPGEARIKQDVHLANETHFEERYLYWANCGIPVNKNTEFIYPENSGALHGDYENEISWPIYSGKNISILKNIDEAVGYYMLNAREGYMGYYNHDENFGLVHYADVNDLPGKKYWSWGWHLTALAKRYTHAEDVNYGEIQSGRIVIQEKFDKIAPMQAIDYTHYWYPVGSIGSFNGASENAAINFIIDKISDNEVEAKIKIQSNQKFTDTRLLFKQGSNTIKEITLSLLSPEKPVEIIKKLNLKKGEIKNISLLLIDNNGKVISNVLSKTEKPKQYDSYLTPKKYAEKKREDFSAEGVFAKAEVLLNDWFYHLPEIVELLNESLTIDPGFSRAHTELGLINLRAGKFEEALKHFDTSLKRVPDDGRTIYYKGLAYMYLGDIVEAKYYLRNSGRFGYEYPERIAEAEISIVQGNYAEALTQLEKAIKLNSTIQKGFILKALVENRIGNNAIAENELLNAIVIDPDNPIILCANYIVNDLSEEISQKVKKRYGEIPEEILEVAAIFYGSGLIEEAFQTLSLIERTNSIVDLYKSELEELTKQKMSSKNEKTVVPDFAWRIEDYLIIKRGIKKNTNNGELYYHLGNYLYAHNFEKEGITNWEKAVELGYEDKVMFVSLYRALKKLKEYNEAYNYLLKAYEIDKDDPYIFEYYVNEINKRNGVNAAIELMVDRYDDFPNAYSLKAKLMNTYMNKGDYDKLDELLLKSNLLDTHRLSYGEFWKNVKMAKGYRKLKEKRYEEALNDFTISTEVPNNIAQHYMARYADQSRRLFYLGYANSKLGNKEKAKELWEEALSLTRKAKFQPMYKYYDIKAVYYQSFCLKGLGRYDEAERYLMLIEEFANTTEVSELTDLRSLLLKLTILGREDIDDFERWDSELGLIKINANFNAPEE